MSAVGVVALARPTFDVEFAEQTAAAAFAVLDAVAPGWKGSRELLFDAAATQRAIDDLADTDLTALVVLQVTFTDASMTKALADAVAAPKIFWAFPEARTGGRLRLNSLCGVNLAAYALRRQGVDFEFMYQAISDAAAAELSAMLDGVPRQVTEPSVAPVEVPPAAYVSADRAVAAMKTASTAVIGEHPDGFDPCAYDPVTVFETTGAIVNQVQLTELFAAAEAASAGAVAAARARAETALGDLGSLEQPALERSLRLFCGLQQLVADNGWTGFATRCWPECFTEFGGAACAPQAMMADDGIPGGCEADAYGTLTSLILMTLAGEPPFVADLVDVDVAEDTAVFWHCGVAPLHMADREAVATPTVHSNRQKPLLHEFPLKPGRVTVARLSQSGGTQSIVIGGGDMLRAGLPFSGTAGVIRFDAPALDVLGTVMERGLEHHYGIVYGDFRAELRALADRWDLPVIALT